MNFFEFERIQKNSDLMDSRLPADLLNPALKQFGADLILFLRGSYLQKDIATKIKHPASLISAIKNMEFGSDHAKLRGYLEKIMNIFQVSFDPAQKEFIFDVAVSARSLINEKAGKDNYFIGGPEATDWKIMVHLPDRYDQRDLVGIRFLKLNTIKSAELIVKLDKHVDYIGQGEFDPSGRQLNFNFEINSDIKEHKYVSLHLITGSRTAKPAFMAGIMKHGHIDKNALSCHTVFAQNITGQAGPFEADKITFEEFAKDNPEIATYFTLHNTGVHTPTGICSLSDIRNNNDKRKRKDRELELRKKEQLEKETQSVNAPPTA
ncbi:hypothetical protein ACFS5N_05895 [Mucilaginibacter ximonensis]|uniref:HTH cro/C1-type domain-containing protein n=1 Tax=Mucilaginibacter ximonensis TaxID=538021 RepID=A0ABW5Y9R4_9SPHI